MLGNSLEKAGYKVVNPKSDADVLIVTTAVQSAKHFNTVVIHVGEDTDLLILLRVHVDVTAMDL